MGFYKGERAQQDPLSAAVLAAAYPAAAGRAGVSRPWRHAADPAAEPAAGRARPAGGAG